MNDVCCNILIVYNTYFECVCISRYLILGESCFICNAKKHPWISIALPQNINHKGRFIVSAVIYVRYVHEEISKTNTYDNVIFAFVGAVANCRCLMFRLAYTAVFSKVCGYQISITAFTESEF